MPGLKLIAGTSHPKLAQEISQKLKVPLVPTTIKRFADGEIYVRVEETVRGEDVFVIKSLGSPVNENLVELLIIIDSLKRASVKSINLIVPYLCYSRQDRKNIGREPITAKLVADLLTKAGASRLLVYDLHADQIQGFFDIPVDNFLGCFLFAKVLNKHYKRNLVIVSPDVGGAKRANKLADLLGVPIAIIDKVRTEHNQSTVAHLVGDVKGKNAILLDDMIDTAGSIVNACYEVKKRGAKKCIICVTHPLFSKDALKKLEKSPAEEIYILNTLSLPNELSYKFKVLSIAPSIAKAIKLMTCKKSLQPLFISA